jgi:hypothetical protein
VGRIQEFYRKKSPKKLQDRNFVEKIASRYKGREHELFSHLDEKYAGENQGDHTSENESGHGGGYFAVSQSSVSVKRGKRQSRPNPSLVKNSSGSAEASNYDGATQAYDETADSSGDDGATQAYDDETADSSGDDGATQAYDGGAASSGSSSDWLTDSSDEAHSSAHSDYSSDSSCGYSSEGDSSSESEAETAENKCTHEDDCQCQVCALENTIEFQRDINFRLDTLPELDKDSLPIVQPDDTTKPADTTKPVNIPPDAIMSDAVESNAADADALSADDDATDKRVLQPHTDLGDNMGVDMDTRSAVELVDYRAEQWRQWREGEQSTILRQNVNYHAPGTFPQRALPDGPSRSASHWVKQPGESGFTEEASAKMRCAFKEEVDAGVFTVKLSFPRAAQPYQKTVPFLVHPDGPCQRMLVVHRVGSGKTMTMIRILDNYFDDPRPKIAVFPNPSIANNFYDELYNNVSNRYQLFCKEQLVNPKNTEFFSEERVRGSPTKNCVRNLLELKHQFAKGKMTRAYEKLREETKTRHGYTMPKVCPLGLCD